MIGNVDFDIGMGRYSTIRFDGCRRDWRIPPDVDVSGSVHVDDSRSFVVDVSRSVGGGREFN
jgi:hypothetical protein